MRRLVAWIGIVLAVSGFVLLALSIWLNIYYLIPIGMIAAAFAALMIAKKMPAEEKTDSTAQPEGEENAHE
ncbi:MAG: hypothetical protein K6F68_01250 [Clostridiales bacterium]|nr:hypothetical protein [Clostridiales bacterium]